MLPSRSQTASPMLDTCGWDPLVVKFSLPSTGFSWWPLSDRHFSPLGTCRVARVIDFI